MNGTEWLVAFGALAAIGWVNWFFFLSGRRAVPAAAPAARPDGTQEVEVMVRGGYEPQAVRVRKGAPVRLVFDRRETSSCSEEVVLPDFGIRRFLPAHERTAVEFTPEVAGMYAFTCGMGMLQGRIMVTDEEA